ncbi:DUF2510 domain-containing protein [Phycicoccus sp.]|uniref:DUF2510 domain-containing protein n=1 Tax=Phycicoccus sp. TaxID=1902410 RepID=UPI002C6907EB|nr:DUF2510 domain-containing protein [Phycicoccus sp.]HMM94292.1 DUF2510 domain-containing protein [Phycicoccus sp.]
MSAPPGWHPQPDGRERWWDGQQWTDHFRDPVAQAPTAPMPATPEAGAPPYGGTAYGSTAYGEPGAGVPASGYGAPGAPAGGPWPPPKQGMSSTAKGCLVAAVVVVVLAIVAVVVGGIFFARTVTRTVDEVRSALPTSSAFPSGLPTGGTPVTIISLGDGFELPNARVDGGWTLEDNGGIGRTVSGMTATFTGATDVPTVFTMEFEGGAQTVCTATPSDGAGTVEVTCIPVFDDVADGARVTVTPTF